MQGKRGELTVGGKGLLTSIILAWLVMLQERAGREGGGRSSRRLVQLPASGRPLLPTACLALTLPDDLGAAGWACSTPLEPALCRLAAAADIKRFAPAAWRAAAVASTGNPNCLCLPACLPQGWEWWGNSQHSRHQASAQRTGWS